MERVSPIIHGDVDKRLAKCKRTLNEANPSIVISDQIYVCHCNRKYFERSTLTRQYLQIRMHLQIYFIISRERHRSIIMSYRRKSTMGGAQLTFEFARKNKRKHTTRTGRSTGVSIFAGLMTLIERPKAVYLSESQNRGDEEFSSQSSSLSSTSATCNLEIFRAPSIWSGLIGGPAMSGVGGPESAEGVCWGQAGPYLVALKVPSYGGTERGRRKRRSPFLK